MCSPTRTPSGVRIVPGPEPIPNLKRRTVSAELQEMELGLANAFNREHVKRNGHDQALAARIRSFETAFQMQTSAPDVRL